MVVVKLERKLPTLHRADIQGLRAIAVLAVLLYHAGGYLPGGYVGVDIFFVISGYVISLAYLGKFETRGLAAVPAFLWRRALRLLPALVVTVVVAAGLSNAILPPTENKLFAIWGAFAATLQVSNLLFIKLGTNYWLDSLSRNPFLHTWSLGVEWQFYALFALGAGLLGGVGHGKFRTVAGRALFALAFAASFALFVFSDGADSFFGPGSRAWQFLLGVAAFLAIQPGNVSQRVRDGAALAALACIVGVAALPVGLLPVRVGSIAASTAAVALIWLAPSAHAAVGRVLCMPAAQAVGKASYSIYLVHWPIIVLGRLLLDDGIFYNCVFLFASLATGMALSRSIEFTFLRDGTARSARAARPVASGIVAACVALVCGAATFVWQFGVSKLPWYANPPFLAAVDGYHNFWWIDLPGVEPVYRHSAEFQYGAFYRRLAGTADLREAVAAVGTDGPAIVGIGNSYIQSSGAMLRAYAVANDARLELYDISNCTPDRQSQCRAAFDAVAQKIALLPQDRTILYIAFRDLSSVAGLADEVERLVAPLARAGVPVIVQGPSPSFDYDPLRCISLVNKCPPDQSLAVGGAQMLASESATYSRFSAISNLIVWSPYRFLCAQDSCIVRQDAKHILMDSDHFSNAGQRYLYPFLAQALDAVVKR